VLQQRNRPFAVHGHSLSRTSIDRRDSSVDDDLVTPFNVPSGNRAVKNPRERDPSQFAVQVLFQREADVEGDLPVFDFPVLDISTRLGDFEPTHVVYGVGCLFDRYADCVVWTLV
jgi:hypothetical protein